jgi:hypothetical protein
MSFPVIADCVRNSFSIVNIYCDTGDSSLRTDADVRKCATEGNDYGVISGTLDGIEIKNLDQYRIDSGFYNITHAADNIYDLPAGWRPI